jgi:predicted nuclease of predicted toxin-antitoxin system
LIVWIDAQLSPALAPWLKQEFGVEAFSVRYLDLVRAKDPAIFAAAREAGVVVMTKDNDFVLLQERLGPPPAILWVRCGNTSNAHLKVVLQHTFPAARRLIDAGEPLVEITDAEAAQSRRA